MAALLLYIPFIVAALGAMLAGLLALGNILPVAALAAAITTANAYIAVVYEFLPLTTVALIGTLGSFLLIEFYVITYKLIKWIYTKLPGVS